MIKRDRCIPILSLEIEIYYNFSIRNALSCVRRASLTNFVLGTKQEFEDLCAIMAKKCEKNPEQVKFKMPIPFRLESNHYCINRHSV